MDDAGKVTNIGVNSPESVQGWTYLKDNVLGTVAPATWDFQTDYDNMNAGFKAGTIMCILQGPWQVADILTGEAFADPTNLVIAPVPEGAAGQDRLAGRRSQLRGQRSTSARTPTSRPRWPASSRYMTEPRRSRRYLAKSLGLLPTNIAAYAIADVAERSAHQPVERRPGRPTNRSGVPGASDIYDSFTRTTRA